MKLVTIPEDKYEEYRLNAIFDCYKWDPQFLDNNTVAKHILVITEEEHKEIKRLTEELDKETRIAEEYINNNLEISKPLALPKRIYNELKRMKNYEPDKHIRLMRYDFHPTIDNKWSVSEVNSDVPGGFAESSLLPILAKSLFPKKNYMNICFGDILTEAISKKVKKNGTIMMVHCTSYSDDRQVMQYLGDKLEKLDYKVLYGAAVSGLSQVISNKLDGKKDLSENVLESMLIGGTAGLVGGAVSVFLQPLVGAGLTATNVAAISSVTSTITFTDLSWRCGLMTPKEAVINYMLSIPLNIIMAPLDVFIDDSYVDVYTKGAATFDKDIITNVIVEDLTTPNNKKNNTKKEKNVKSTNSNTEVKKDNKSSIKLPDLFPKPRVLNPIELRKEIAKNNLEKKNHHCYYLEDKEKMRRMDYELF